MSFPVSRPSVRLSPRMSRIASLIDRSKLVADIGTDHGLLPAYLLTENISESVVASDINRMPLEKARQNLERYGVIEKARLVLCDGLWGVLSFRPQNIVIAGLGGETIAEIISPLEDSIDYLPKLILQPMSKPERLRAYLFQKRFRIERELLCREGTKLYSIIIAHPRLIYEADDERDSFISDIVLENDGNRQTKFLSIWQTYVGELDLSDTQTAENELDYLKGLLWAAKRRVGDELAPTLCGMIENRIKELLS